MLEHQFMHIRVRENPPRVLMEYAGAEDLPILVTRRKFTLSMNADGKFKDNCHNLGPDVTRQIPMAMNTPVVVVRRKKESISEIIRVTSDEGPILMAMQLSSEKGVCWR